MSAESFLELLVRDASAIEFETPLLDARARGADATTLGGLERAKLVALQVRETLEARRRRETELRALYETANDLAALRDVDAVLQAIVHRARQLLATDVAYLSLNDPEHDDTYMRVTDGSVSSLFQQVRLPMGAGLGGLVAQSATPYATASYFEDERFRHTHGIDTAVRDEGLLAILGVPLVIGTEVLGVLCTEVLGVLCAANRSARPFAREEVSLLVSLAAHAAVAIDSARLTEEIRRTVTDLESAHELVDSHSRSVERAAAAHDRFADLVLRGGGVEDVAAAVAVVLNSGVVVVDQDSRRLTTSPDAPLGQVLDSSGRLLEELGPTMEAALEAGRTAQTGLRWVTPVLAGSTRLGALVLLDHTGLEEADQRILEGAAVVTALLLMFRRASAEAQQRVAGGLLHDLFQQTGHDPAWLRERARLLGVDIDAPLVLVVARCPVKQQHRAALAAAHLASTRHGLAAPHANHVDLLLPAVGSGELAGLVAHELTVATGVPVTCGAAGPVASLSGPDGMGHLPSTHAEALRCVDTLLALGRRGEGVEASDLGFIGFALADRPNVPEFVRGCLGPLFDYDGRRHTDLVATLAAYFAAGQSRARASQELHIHVHTVTQRLDRVTQLLGEGWQAPERALEIQVALRLQRLLAADLLG